jgi:HlyD family secretion protein
MDTQTRGSWKTGSAIASLLVAGGLMGAALLSSILAGCSLRGAVAPGDVPITVAQVKRGDFQLRVHATGELRSTHTIPLTAPPIGGGTLQIIRLLPTGTAVKAGEVVVDFDPSEQEYNLAQSQSDLNEAQEEITKAKDDAAVQSAEDQTALLTDRFAVRQAELQVSKNELLSAIDAKKNILALDEAKRALAQLQQDMQSHAASNQAAITLAQQKLDKARLSISEARRNIASMEVRAPIDGLVVVSENWQASGGIFFSGMTLPQYQVGDQVGPGSHVADVVDIDRLEITGQVAQADRTNIQEGDPVEIRVDAIPGATFTGKVARVAGIAAGGFFGPGVNAKVDFTVRLDHPDPRLRPGFSAQLVVVGKKLQDVLTVPREAVFDLTGTPKVYVRSESGFEPRNVKIRYLTDATAVIDGLAPRTEVALVNPQQQSAGPAKPAASAPVPGPGGR